MVDFLHRRDILLALLNETHAVGSELKKQDYPSIYKSLEMIAIIIELVKVNIRPPKVYKFKKLDFDALAKIDIGLLAAKVLDHDDRFELYSNLLHRCWAAFLLYLGVYK